MPKNIRSRSNYNEFTSLSTGLEYIPARRNILGDLGIFEKEFLNTNTVDIPRTTINDYKMKPIPWGTRAQNTQGNTKGVLTLRIPHHEVEDAIKPEDVQGKIDFDDFSLQDRPETIQAIVRRKMKTAKQTVANTWSDGMIRLIRDGESLGAHDTILANFYDEFDVIRTELNIDLVAANDPVPSIQAAIDNIQDNFKGGYVPTQFVALANRTFFDALARNAYVVDQARYRVSGDRQSVEILTGRLGTQGYNLGKEYQVLDFAGVIWIRVTDDEIPVNEARMFPTDIPDMFKVFFANSQINFDYVNTTALEAYYFEKMSEARDLVSIRYETNPLFVTLWPKALIKLTGVFA